MNTRIAQAIESIDARFRSGNAIPIDRAMVTREEWEELKATAFTVAGLRQIHAEPQQEARRA